MPLLRRYGIGLLAFAIPLLIAYPLRQYLIRFDLGLLIVGALMAATWYGGLGPGLMDAILFEVAAVFLVNPPQVSLPRLVFAELNRTALLVIVVVLVNSRKKVETRLRAQHERLRASEEHFSKAFNASPVPMSIVTYRDGRYIEVNDAFLRNSGYERDEIIGRTTTEITIYAEPGERDRLRRILEEHGNIRNVEVRRRVKHGEVRTALTSSEIITLDGERCILTTTNDITERKQLEEQLRQSQKMEAVGRLAGGVAHDFNNLLTAIIGFSELAATRLKQGDPVHGLIEEVMKAGRRAAELTNQLLAFSRRQILQPRVFNLNDAIADISRMLQRLIGEDVELRLSLDKGIGSVKVDPGQVEQIIINLAVNAREAMQKGGKVTIETRAVELDESYAAQHVDVQPGAYVMLAVTDTGTGMDAETRSRIFEPFFTTKGKYGGSGLGLATVYGIVKQSGGHIWVYSEPGTGTIFKIYLPRIDQATETRETPAIARESLQGSETVLVVEDEELVRNLACQVLQVNGYTVLNASDATEALLKYEQYQGRLDLLITDVVMPRASGPELARRLASSRPQMKVLYMSGYADDAIVHHGILDPGTSFLQKPFTPDALAGKVRAVLDARQSS